MTCKVDKMFCTAPFELLMFGNGGQNWICCPAWLPVSVGKTIKGSLSADWNSSAAQQIRSSIHDGTFSLCKPTCPHLTKKSGFVKKVSEIQDPALRMYIEEKTTMLPSGPKKIYFSHDRTCNLACPSCRNGFIRANEKEQHRLEVLQNDALSSFSQSIEELYVSGDGDPFSSPTLNKLLVELDPEKYPNLKLIHLHTNAQMWNEENWKKLSHIHFLVKSAHISIDAATSATYRINRPGGSFKRLMRNLEFIKDIRAKIHISFVVQQNNYSEMKEFARLGREILDFNVIFTHIDNWGNLSSAEYIKRAVHQASHPEHHLLVEVLQDPVFNDPRIDLGNLTHLSSYTPSHHALSLDFL